MNPPKITFRNIAGTFEVYIAGVKCDVVDNIEGGAFRLYRETTIKIGELQNEEVTSDNVTYYLYTRQNGDKYIQLDQSNLYLLQYQKIVFFIHGWKNSRQVAWYEKLKNAFLSNYEYYVVQVDWSGPASQLYYIAANSTSNIGKCHTHV